MAISEGGRVKPTTVPDAVDDQKKSTVSTKLKSLVNKFQSPIEGRNSSSPMVKQSSDPKSQSKGITPPGKLISKAIMAATKSSEMLKSSPGSVNLKEKGAIQMNVPVSSVNNSAERLKGTPILANVNSAREKAKSSSVSMSKSSATLRDDTLVKAAKMDTSVGTKVQTEIKKEHSAMGKRIHSSTKLAAVVFREVVSSSEAIPRADTEVISNEAEEGNYNSNGVPSNALAMSITKEMDQFSSSPSHSSKKMKKSGSEDSISVSNIVDTEMAGMPSPNT